VKQPGRQHAERRHARCDPDLWV